MLIIKGLTKEYLSKRKHKKIALTGINLTFPNKGLIIINGQTGCGKTTLLNMIGKLDVPTSGEIIYNNTSILEYTKKETEAYLNSEIGFVFQEYNLINDLRVIDNLRMVYELSGKEIDEEKIDTLLEYFKITETKNKLCDELSGGERQRVALIRALLKDAKIILADEPTGAVDKKTGELIINYLKEISKERLVIVVTHNEEYGPKYADQIIKMEDGMVVYNNKIGETKEEVTENKLTEVKNLKFLTMIKLAYHYLKTNLKYLLALLIVTVISFSFIGLLLSFTTINEDQMIARYIQENKINYLNVTDYALAKAISEPDVTDSNYLDYQQVDHYLQKNKISSYPYYNYNEHLDNISFESNFQKENMETDSNTSGFVTLDEKEIKEFKCKILAGTLPKKENEIAISTYFYEQFVINGYYNYLTGIKKSITTYEDLIGLEVNLFSKSLIITGIIDCGFDLNQFTEEYKEDDSNRYLGYYLHLERKHGLITKLFVHPSFIEKTILPIVNSKEKRFKITYESFNQEIRKIEEYQENKASTDIYLFKDENKLEDNEIIIKYDLIKDFSLKDNLTIDAMVKAEIDKIALSTAKEVCKDTLTFIEHDFDGNPIIESDGSYKTYTFKNIEEYATYIKRTDINIYHSAYNLKYLFKISTKAVFNSLTEKEYLTLVNQFNVSAKVKIAGVIDGDSFFENYPDTYISSTLNEKLLANYTINTCAGVYIPTKNFKSLNSVIKSINKSDEINCLNFQTFMLNIIELEYNEIIKIMKIVLIVLTIIICFIYQNYLSMVIKNKHHQIGILRSLGIKRNNLTKIFIIHSLLIALGVYLLSIILGNILTIIARNILVTDFGLRIVILYYGLTVYGIILGVMLLMSTVSAIIPIVKMNKLSSRALFKKSYN